MRNARQMVGWLLAVWCWTSGHAGAQALASGAVAAADRPHPDFVAKRTEWVVYRDGQTLPQRRENMEAVLTRALTHWSVGPQDAESRSDQEALGGPQPSTAQAWVLALLEANGAGEGEFNGNGHEQLAMAQGRSVWVWESIKHPQGNHSVGLAAEGTSVHWSTSDRDWQVGAGPIWVTSSFGLEKRWVGLGPEALPGHHAPVIKAQPEGQTRWEMACLKPGPRHASTVLHADADQHVYLEERMGEDGQVMAATWYLGGHAVDGLTLPQVTVSLRQERVHQGPDTTGMTVTLLDSVAVGEPAVKALESLVDAHPVVAGRAVCDARMAGMMALDPLDKPMPLDDFLAWLPPLPEAND